MRAFKCFVRSHAPASLSDLKSEHVIMASAYGTAAATIHHWVGSVVVAAGYFTAAVLGARENHRQTESNQ